MASKQRSPNGPEYTHSNVHTYLEETSRVNKTQWEPHLQEQAVILRAFPRRRFPLDSAYCEHLL